MKDKKGPLQCTTMYALHFAYHNKQKLEPNIDVYGPITWLRFLVLSLAGTIINECDQAGLLRL